MHSTIFLKCYWLYVHTKVQLPSHFFFCGYIWSCFALERERDWEMGEKKKIQLREAAFRLFPSHDKLGDRQGMGERRLLHFPGVDAASLVSASQAARPSADSHYCRICCQLCIWIYEPQLAYNVNKHPVAWRTGTYCDWDISVCENSLHLFFGVTMGVETMKL